MGFVLVLRELLSRRRLLALGAVVALVAAILSVYRFDGGKLKARTLQYSSASTQILVDSSSSAFGNVSQTIEPLAARASVYASFMTNPAVLALIGQRVGLSGEQIFAQGPALGATRTEQEPTAAKRNVQLTGEAKPYRLAFETHETLPTITINSQAPTTKLAVGLANAAAAGVAEYVSRTETANGVPPRSRVVIRQLGTANGGVVDTGISKELAFIVFVVVFAAWCVLMLVAARFRESWRASAALDGDEYRPGGEAGRMRDDLEDIPDVGQQGFDLGDADDFEHSARVGDDRVAASMRGPR